MNKRFQWTALVFLAAAGVLVWCKFSLPRYQSIDLSVTPIQAIDISKSFMKEKRGVDMMGWRVATSLYVDDATDRYLQKTLGNDAYRAFIHRMHYDLFSWVVRFFKEKQKEEYKIAVSCATGQVVGFNHIIEDTAGRPVVPQDKARQHALDFLNTTFGFDPTARILHGENVRKLDNRQDYAFSWQDKNVDIPWGKGAAQGHAKLLSSVTVSGDEILSFSKYQFEIPDAFNRYVDNLKQTGENLTLVFRIIYLSLITMAIVVVVNRKQQVVARAVKPFYVAVGIVMFTVLVLDVLNSYQDIMASYPTTQSLGNYVIRQFIENIIGPIFVTVGFILPALAGESLRFEVAGADKHRGFLTALQSSFFSTSISRQIFIGYLAAAVILGLQAFIFNLGFKYCGVWDEFSWLTQASTSVVPAFTAMVIGFHASFSEESMFRLFAINFFKKYRLPTALAVFLSAGIWGFGHTGYEIFPQWFRGIEVTCIGVVMGIFYLRVGLMCVVVAHFLIDAYLTGLPYLLNPHLGFNFYSALFVVGLPAVLALAALIFDRRAAERPLSVRFNAQQQFNYNLLMELYRNKSPEERAVLKNELERHGWDTAIIQRVFEGRS